MFEPKYIRNAFIFHLNRRNKFEYYSAKDKWFLGIFIIEQNSDFLSKLLVFPIKSNRRALFDAPSCPVLGSAIKSPHILFCFLWLCRCARLRIPQLSGQSITSSKWISNGVRLRRNVNPISNEYYELLYGFTFLQSSGRARLERELIKIVTSLGKALLPHCCTVQYFVTLVTHSLWASNSSREIVKADFVVRVQHNGTWRLELTTCARSVWMNIESVCARWLWPKFFDRSMASHRHWLNRFIAVSLSADCAQRLYLIANLITQLFYVRPPCLRRSHRQRRQHRHHRHHLAFWLAGWQEDMGFLSAVGCLIVIGAALLWSLLVLSADRGWREK